MVIGLGSMLGAGVFAAVGPAARAAGWGLLLGLLLAGAVAYCNATSSAALAAVYPASGGTYVYGRERLGPFWGYIAGWGFVVGKTASCAAMALTVGAYAAPSWQRPIAIGSVAALTAVNYRGVRKTAALTKLLVALTLGALALVVTASVAGGSREIHIGDVGLHDLLGDGLLGILRSAGLLFFAFAGYARIATLGEEVEDPARTIPKAIPRALGITLVIYLIVMTSALAAVGPAGLARSVSPLAAAVRAGGIDGLVPAVRIGGAVAGLGVLLSLIAGISRTIFSMAENRELPGWLAAVHPVHAVPHRAEVTVGVVVAAVVAVVDLRDAIGFSSFCVLGYYAIANAAALTLPAHLRRWPRPFAAAGVVGCVVIALTLPPASVLTGLAVLTAGASARWLRQSRLHLSR